MARAKPKPRGDVALVALQSLKTWDGKWHKRGAALTVTRSEAEELIKAGKAERPKAAEAS
jgi:hypothetical protein